MHGDGDRDREAHAERGDCPAEVRNNPSVRAAGPAHLAGVMSIDGAGGDRPLARADDLVVQVR
jgi:hypothetical protein